MSDPGSYLAASRAAAAHVFVDDLEVPVLSADDAHHLARVLRLQPGEMVSVVDGLGGWRLCAFTGGKGAVTGGRGAAGGSGYGAVAEGQGPPGAKGEVGANGRQAGLEPVGPVCHPQVLTPPIAVGFALTKGDRPEWAVQKLTEIGVDRIIPLHTARSVVRWDGDRAGRHLDRLREVARQAAMQSRRLILPVLDEVSTPGQVLAAATTPSGATPAGGVPVLAVPGGAGPSLAHPTVLVGPEGGWSPEEEQAAPATIGLGPTVLRTETAAMVAGTLLAALRSSVATHDGQGSR